MSQTEIITDIQVKKPARAGSLWMEVKVDPGSEANCMPLHKFKTLFPYLCRDGLPKEGALVPSTAEFTGYGGTDMQSLGYLGVTYTEYQHQEVSHLEVSRVGDRQPKDPCMPCSSTLDRFGQGAMCQQSTHKASRFPYS